MDLSSAACSFLLAQANVARVQDSYLVSLFHSAGPVSLLILLAGLAVFIGACFVVVKSPTTVGHRLLPYSVAAAADSQYIWTACWAS